MSVYDTLKERGFIEQCTHEDEIRAILENEQAAFYIGFDATADSLHVGHFIQIMVMKHMQNAGHIPIALLGGGTTMVGDPSGRTDMRKMLTPEDIAHNTKKFEAMFAKYIDFSNGNAIMANNADWLLDLNYIDFLRDIGPYFSVNRMLAADAYKSRMAEGLTFLEFNYMIMQAYDFYVLHEKHNCKIQLGGSDQWSNIIAGVELIRRKKSQDAYGMTFTLLVNSEGNKMGKTASGAVWLDPEKTSPYELYQYWRNVGDSEVENCLALLTFIPMEEVRELGSLEGEMINAAKERLAFEVTKLVHGQESAEAAQKTAKDIFGLTGESSDMPSATLDAGIIGSDVASLLVACGLASSKSEARRLIEQGGIRINSEKAADPAQIVQPKDFEQGYAILQKGKRVFIRALLKA
ncbi:MAG: tyrosine--tRNA ligase [Eubacteriaceae bacterium]|nr:tyrosine--tRNA ligase [Eubacteriaceae bacterium]